MRKLIGLGLTAVTTATMAFGALGSTPAHAVVSPPGSLVGQVCAVLPTQLSGVNTTVISLLATQSTAVTGLNTAKAALDSASSDFIIALVDYLKTYDAGGSVGAKSLIMQDALSVYSDKGAAWVNAWNAKDIADRNAAVGQINQGMLTQLSGLLTTCPV